MKLSNNEINSLKILFSRIDLKSYPELLHLKDKLIQKITVDLYIDGSADLKTKTAGIGGVIFIDNKESHSFSEYLHDSTNNEAEYEALIYGLELLLKNNYLSVNIFSDSQLVVNQVNGLYKVKNERMKLLHSRTISLINNLENWNFSHVLREKNKIADSYADAGRRQSK